MTRASAPARAGHWQRATGFSGTPRSSIAQLRGRERISESLNVSSVLLSMKKKFFLIIK